MYSEFDSICLQIPHPELPHATRAVSAEKPHGDETANNRTVLQQHVDFFDRNKDGRPSLNILLCGPRLILTIMKVRRGMQDYEKAP